MTEGTVLTKAPLPVLAATVLLAAGAQAAGAQGAVDARWLPWTGCWQSVEAPAEAPMTCVRPGPAGGVELLTVTSEGVLETRALHADGIERSVATEQCTGSESAEFSSDGTRVYLRSEMACDGGAPRTTRGLIAMVDRDQWIDVQAMEIDGRSVAWTQRFEPAPRGRVVAAGQGDIQELVDRRASEIRRARMMASAPITVDEIIETHARTDAEAVRVWVAEQGYPVPLDAASLRRMADAGVPGDVIDVVVAVTYPEQFALADGPPPAYRDRGPRRGVYGPYPGYPGYWDPYFGYYGMGLGGWGWGWRSPFFYGFHRPSVIVVAPRTGARGVQLIRGRGYTGTGASSGEGRRASPRGAVSSPGATRSSGEVRAPQRPSTRQPAASSPPARSGDRRSPPRRAQPRND